MVAVEPLRLFLVKTVEFIELAPNDVLERPDESRVKHDLSKPVL
jgi:hypothetical protein